MQTQFCARIRDASKWVRSTRYIDDLFEGFACCQEKTKGAVICLWKIMLVDLGGLGWMYFLSFFIDLLSFFIVWLFLDSLIHSLVSQSFVRPSVRPSVHWFIRSFVHSFICLPFCLMLIRSFICFFSHSFMIYLLIHFYILYTFVTFFHTSTSG